MIAKEAIAEVFGDPNVTYTWGQWVQCLASTGVTVTSDDSGFMDTKVLKPDEARAAFMLCKYEFQEPSDDPEPADLSVETIKVEKISGANPKSLSVRQWREKYDYVSKNPPINEFVQAEKGMIRLEVELHPDKPPFIFTRLYIRNVVGVDPVWLAQGEKMTNSFGWKVVLLPKSRDEVIRKHGVMRNTIHVKTIRIVKVSSTGRSLLGEVVEW